MFRYPILVALLLCPVSAILVLGDLVLGDTVEISGGGHLDGKVNRKGKTVIVAVDDDIQVAIPASRVRRVVMSDQLSDYRRLAAAAGNDAERHYELARWCLQGDNVPGEKEYYKRFHMQRVIDLDPDHSRARASLGYTRDAGKWVLHADLMSERGMIWDGGKGWVLPEAAAIQEFLDETNKESRLWSKNVAMWTKSVLRNSKKASESLEALRSIGDPNAASAIAAQLKSSRENQTQSRSLRLLWINLLGRFRTSVSVEALVRAGLEERDEVVREAALDQLVEYGASSAVATYLQYLKSNDNQLLNRAARALTWFPDPELALTYVDSLVTTHKTELAPAPGMQVGFGQGGGGLQMGGKKKVLVEDKTNPSVLTLVKSIEPNVDYGFDEQAWRMHFANQRTSFSGDLRRDP